MAMGPLTEVLFKVLGGNYSFVPVLSGIAYCNEYKYRRLISKSAFMQFLAILTFLHIWNNESQGYLKMQGPW